MADSLLNITVGVLEQPATVTERALFASGDYHSAEGRARLVRELGGFIARGSRVLARVDSCTRGAATATIVIDNSDGTAGDQLRFYVPGENVQRVDVVASGGTPANQSLNLSQTDTASGNELVAIIEANRVLNHYFTASNSSGTVTLTARQPGSWANDMSVIKEEADGGTFTITNWAGGDDVLDQPTMDIVFGTPDITADDTISIGARTYTWKASASADGEITLSTTPATAATNFAAAVNADANLTGLVTASVDTATVTLTFVCDPRVAQHIVVAYTEANAGSVVPAGTVVGVTGAEAPLIGTTVTGSSSTRNFGSGAA